MLESLRRAELHPTVILGVTDSFTRASVQGFESPIAGAILGRHHQSVTTLEVAYACKVIVDDSSGTVALDSEWFDARLSQYKDVFQTPALDLVGWYATCPPTGPQAPHHTIHRQISERCGENAILLTYHPSHTLPTSDLTVNEDLPISIYETDSENASKQTEMDISLEVVPLQFRSLPYTIESDDTEKIALDTIFREAFLAPLTKNSQPIAKEAEHSQNEAKGQDEVLDGGSDGVEQYSLSAEDEKSIRELSSQANAMGMLCRRIQQIIDYLDSIESTASSASGSEIYDDNAQYHLRFIRALLTRLRLMVEPTKSPAFANEMAQQDIAAEISSLMGSMGDSILTATETGEKFAVFEKGKSNNRKHNISAAMGR